MVFTLLASLIATTVTGLKVYGEEGHGPLAAQANIKVIADAKASSLHEIKVHDGEHHEHESEWEEIHEFFANFTVFLIMLHILGVIVSTYLEKQNLVMVMITGYKRPIDTEK
jgi:cytochrome b